MIIVRRRTDGKYYNGVRSNGSGGGWVDSPNECLPYKSKRGAFGALGRSCYDRIPVEGQRYHTYRYNPTRWDEQYEVLPVKVILA